MSLRTRLQIAILALVAGIVIVLSGVYLRSVVENRLADAREIASINAQQVHSFILGVIGTESAERAPATGDLEGATDFWIEIVEQDVELGLLLENLMGNSPVIVESLVTGPDDRILAASIGTKRGQRHTPLPSFSEFEGRSWWAKLAEAFSGNQDYEVVRELGVGQQTVFTVRMVLSTVLLRTEVQPQIERLAIASTVALLTSLLAAVVVSSIAVRPLERIGGMIDRIAQGDAVEDTEPADASEVAAVQTKLSLLGERFRGARDDADSLRDNIDQLLTRLEEAVLLFGPDDRLTMAGGSAERLLGPRWELIGRSIEELFPSDAPIGALLRSAVEFRRSVKDQAVEFRPSGGDPMRLLLTAEVMEEFPTRDRIGTMVMLREADPRRQIESRLDVSSRLAAISRLTSGAAHEIKNPLNSIALHLEILKSKLGEPESGAEEIEVITREITRLDRVVKSFLDFTRPVELDMAAFDFRELGRELVELIRPEAEQRGIVAQLVEPTEHAWVRGDRDLIKQALLNVFANAVEAMPAGGALDAAIESEDGTWLLRVRDQGAGITSEQREKVYQLYFTTKQKGSGIGLAMTFQVVQLHGGTIEFESEVGKGTEFRIHLPAEQQAPHSKEPAAEQRPAG